MQRKRSLRQLGMWVLGLGALGIGLGWAWSRQDEQPQDPTPAASSEQAAAAPAVTRTWIDSVDAWFGTYLVGPMARVIFFDFGTERNIKLQGNYQGTDDATGTRYRIAQKPDGSIRIEVIRSLGRDQLEVKRHEFASAESLRQSDAELFKRFQLYAVPENRVGVAIPFVVVWLLGAGIFFTLFMRFINLRAFGHSINLIRGKYDDPNNPGEVSHFQALASALSATVGLGNIAGVAIAIGLGGPGATFWMILAGFLGMTTKFAECTLGQMYRKVSPDGVVSGGPMHYLRDGLAEMGLGGLGKILAVVFAILCIGGSLGGGNAFQVGQSLGIVRTEFSFLDHYPWIYGLLMAFFVGIVIIGGIRSIASVASKIVPFMCGAYVLAALYILFHNASHIPQAFGMIFSGAFTWEAGFGGFVGVLVIGMKRAVFSNEAGAGSAAIAHSAAKTKEPVSEGIVALLEPFIDTIVVCTMTALVIIITGVYNNPDNAHLVIGDQGAALTKVAFIQGGHDWFRWILLGAVVLFAYSTMISWSYYGERCWTSLFGIKASMSYKVLFLFFVFLGSIVTATNIKDFSDLLILGMSFPNLIGVLLLSGKVRRALNKYMDDLRAGSLKH